MFTVAGLFPLKPVMLLIPYHMLLAFVGVELFFNLFFVVFGGFDGFPEIVTGCFRSPMFPDLKVNDKATGTSLLIHGFGWGRCGLFFWVLRLLHTS